MEQSSQLSQDTQDHQQSQLGRPEKEKEPSTTADASAQQVLGKVKGRRAREKFSRFLFIEQRLRLHGYCDAVHVVNDRSNSDSSNSDSSNISDINDGSNSEGLVVSQSSEPILSMETLSMARTLSTITPSSSSPNLYQSSASRFKSLRSSTRSNVSPSSNFTSQSSQSRREEHQRRQTGPNPFAFF